MRVKPAAKIGQENKGLKTFAFQCISIFNLPALPQART
jgi:hypothetical protein